MSSTSKVQNVPNDWLAKLENLAYLDGKPKLKGSLKSVPEDFIVHEVMDVVPCGEGEHYWLDITKIRLNTDAVAKSLARFSGVVYRDVGYSGMKDYQAIARQWFSVWKPKGEALDWSKYSCDGVLINRVVKHNRKIKRGTHKANRFEIRVVGLAGGEDIQQILNSRLTHIEQRGVPNYFGSQRFGRRANNMQQVLAMFSGKRRIKDRNLRSILLSSARSWLFNTVVSARVDAGTWESLYLGEPANLNGSNSVFVVDDLGAETQRLNDLDIHPTAPLWGERKRAGERNKGDETKKDDSQVMDTELIELERSAMSAYQPLKSGLEDARLEYQRRALRLVPKDLKWHYCNQSSGDDDLCISFELARGQFATSVLRELLVETS